LSLAEPEDPNDACSRHGRVGTRRVCEHLAQQVSAQCPALVAARVDATTPDGDEELDLGGPRVWLSFCRACAETLKLPAISRLPATVEVDAAAGTTVCAACLDEAVAEAAAAAALR
jgi:hypothetical protein